MQGQRIETRTERFLGQGGLAGGPHRSRTGRGGGDGPRIHARHGGGIPAGEDVVVDSFLGAGVRTRIHTERHFPALPEFEARRPLRRPDGGGVDPVVRRAGSLPACVRTSPPDGVDRRESSDGLPGAEAARRRTWPRVRRATLARIRHHVREHVPRSHRDSVLA